MIYEQYTMYYYTNDYDSTKYSGYQTLIHLLSSHNNCPQNHHLEYHGIIFSKEKHEKKNLYINFIDEMEIKV